VFQSVFGKIRARFGRARLRTQLLVTVNLFVAVVMVGFLYLDYHHSVRSQLSEKVIALSEEARTIDAAVQELRHLGPAAVQRHIDTICATMNTNESPGHSIEVVLDGEHLVSEASTHNHDHNTPWVQLVSGSSASNGVVVRVGERRQPLIDNARREMLARMSVIAAAAAIGALGLNLLLVRLVTRPLEQTLEAVRDVGHGQLGTTVEVSANRELTLLAHDVSEMSKELARRDSDRNAQLDRARRLQSHLIPREIEREVIGIAIEFHPADEIAGDFVDVIECPNGDTLLCVADVVGHGIHAAMGSAVLKALLLAIDLDEPSPAAMLGSINQIYCQTSLPEDFASMILMRVSPGSKKIIYASAGHELGYIRHYDGTRGDISSTGTVLGVDKDAGCDDIELPLCAGDLVVLLSDGVSETFNSDRKLLGRDAIASAVENPANQEASAMARSIIDIAITHRGDTPAIDDMTVLVLTVTHENSKTTLSACVDPVHT
jgi:phosphoserine phosphatase RsbU/P